MKKDIENDNTSLKQSPEETTRLFVNIGNALLLISVIATSIGIYTYNNYYMSLSERGPFSPYSILYYYSSHNFLLLTLLWLYYSGRFFLKKKRIPRFLFSIPWVLLYLHLSKDTIVLVLVEMNRIGNEAGAIMNEASAVLLLRVATVLIACIGLLYIIAVLCRAIVKKRDKH